MKVRGYRIELGEIESVLVEHPAMTPAMVTAHEYGPRRHPPGRLHRPRRRRFDPGNRELRTSLSAKLPDYMVPTAFVTLDALPLTPNNKINRKDLPKPDLRTLATPTGPAQPRPENQDLLLELWQSVLGTHNIGVDDNFFDLGGHSLLATRIVSQDTGAAWDRPRGPHRVRPSHGR